MNEYPSKTLQEAVEAIGSLPGVGSRSALRLALHLLRHGIGGDRCGRTGKDQDGDEQIPAKSQSCRQGNGGQRKQKKLCRQGYG